MTELKTRVTLVKDGVSIDVVLQAGGTSEFKVVVGQKEFGPYVNTGPAMTRFYEQVGKMAVNGWRVAQDQESLNDERRAP